MNIIKLNIELNNVNYRGHGIRYVNYQGKRCATIPYAKNLKVSFFMFV